MKDYKSWESLPPPTSVTPGKEDLWDRFKFRYKRNHERIMGPTGLPFSAEEREKLSKLTTPMQIVGRVDSVELLPLTDVAVGSVYLVGQAGSASFEEYVVIGLEPTTYESLGKMATVPNWEQTDETAGYIANKPDIRVGEGNGSIIECDLVGNSSIGNYSHAEGASTTASGGNSHAEGERTTANGSSSHAEGYHTQASGQHSHAEGSDTIASGENSHAEGYNTTASGQHSHAEGCNATASGNYSHAEGFLSIASGNHSHAEGGETTALGNYSHAEGYSTTANNKSQHVFGENNIADPSLNIPDARGLYVEIVGNGLASSARSNARTLDWKGNEYLQGTEEASLFIGHAPSNESISGNLVWSMADLQRLKIVTLSLATNTITLPNGGNKTFSLQIKVIQDATGSRGLTFVMDDGNGGTTNIKNPSEVDFSSGSANQSCIATLLYDGNGSWWIEATGYVD